MNLVATPHLVLPNFALLLGPMLISQFMNWGLFGVLTVQLYIYYLAFPGDPRHRKLTVAMLYALETVQLILTTHDAFITYAAQWGDLAHVDGIKTLWIGIPIMTGLIGCVVQLFYARRVLLISRGNFWITGAVVITAITQAGLSIWAGVVAREIGQLTILPWSHNFNVFVVWLGTTAFCDLIITLSISYYLYKARRSLASRRTSIIVTRLIKLTIETGFVTAASAIVEAILFVVSRNTLMYSIFMGITCKLYSNCLLAILNARISMQATTSTDDPITLSLMGTQSVSAPNHARLPLHFPIKSQIEVSREIIVDISPGHRGHEQAEDK
ncbi:hypothetical protein EIP91_008253 [Steccherinum ochraceum]|uniref:DUF6534 domain-containing protein n=1 Tax=Steccherinum ochraceum TaxID=92696 RepID=A0A4R0R350_9APHY|nr:hypothetical protein EIP91_008253 [Steccherinum ochraceum]